MSLGSNMPRKRNASPKSLSQRGSHHAPADTFLGPRSGLLTVCTTYPNGLA
jgi:hypothetical protein